MYLQNETDKISSVPEKSHCVNNSVIEMEKITLFSKLEVQACPESQGITCIYGALKKNMNRTDDVLNESINCAKKMFSAAIFLNNFDYMKSLYHLKITVS